MGVGEGSVCGFGGHIQASRDGFTASSGTNIHRSHWVALKNEPMIAA